MGNVPSIGVAGVSPASMASVYLVDTYVAGYVGNGSEGSGYRCTGDSFYVSYYSVVSNVVGGSYDYTPVGPDAGFGGTKTTVPVASPEMDGDDPPYSAFCPHWLNSQDKV